MSIHVNDAQSNLHCLKFLTIKRAPKVTLQLYSKCFISTSYLVHWDIIWSPPNFGASSRTPSQFLQEELGAGWEIIITSVCPRSAGPNKWLCSFKENFKC